MVNLRDKMLAPLPHATGARGERSIMPSAEVSPR
jgi:hypothetical protein